MKKEGTLWLDENRSELDVQVSIFPPLHEQGKAPADPTTSVVFAASSLLSAIPYFQTYLSQPWQKEISSPTAHGRRDIVLRCTNSTSPLDYVKCLLFIKLQSPPPMSVDDALRLLRAADHLLFQEFADYCMAYLASSPWSDNEEESIQQAISPIGMNPSSDLSAILTVADDLKVFKEVLGSLTKNAATNESLFRDFVKATFTEASEEVRSVCVSVIQDAWKASTNRLIEESASAFSSWNVLTKVLLEHGGSKKLLDGFVGVSMKLSTAMIRLMEAGSLSTKQVAEILSELLLRALPKSSDNNAVLLSNSDRARLVAWARAPIFWKLNYKPLNSAFSQLFMSLPVQDPLVVGLVKTQVGNAYFDTCYKWWRSKLFKRMNRCDIVLASNSAQKVMGADTWEAQLQSP